MWPGHRTLHSDKTPRRAHTLPPLLTWSWVALEQRSTCELSPGRLSREVIDRVLEDLLASSIPCQIHASPVRMLSCEEESLGVRH